jgi:putative cardiolipin synthase
MHATARDLRADMPRMLEALQGSPVLGRFPLDRKDWSAELADFAKSASLGASHVLTDLPAPSAVRHRMPGAMRDFMASAKSELLIANSYVIPDDNDIALFEELRSRNVRVRILTNSLASQDVPAVNSHYKRWRKPLLKAGVDLYESRADAATGPTLADTPPAHAEFMGFHVKAVVVDRDRLFVGSMNLDPRSQELNSEMGVVIDSAPLARQIADLVEQDMQPANAWHVTLNERGSLRWTAGGKSLARQPARSAWQRAQDLFFMLFPRNLY